MARSTPPFAFVELPKARSQRKPRTTGLTMVADFGLPLGHFRELVEMAGPYMDLFKIAFGRSRLYKRSYLQRKLAFGSMN